MQFLARVKWRGTKNVRREQPSRACYLWTLLFPLLSIFLSNNITSAISENLKASAIVSNNRTMFRKMNIWLLRSDAAAIALIAKTAILLYYGTVLQRLKNIPNFKAFRSRSDRVDFRSRVRRNVRRYFRRYIRREVAVEIEDSKGAQRIFSMDVAMARRLRLLIDVCFLGIKELY